MCTTTLMVKCGPMECEKDSTCRRQHIFHLGTIHHDVLNFVTLCLLRICWLLLLSTLQCPCTSAANDVTTLSSKPVPNCGFFVQHEDNQPSVWNLILDCPPILSMLHCKVLVPHLLEALHPTSCLLSLSLTSHCQSTSLLFTENIMSDARSATGERSKPGQLKIAEP